MRSKSDIKYPNGKNFAFSIIDDTDVATRSNVEPIYHLLDKLGFKTTKTVWPLSWNEGWSAFEGSETLEDKEYTDFLVDLVRRGFEIASHGAAMESSEREKIIRGLGRFEEVFGNLARVHANHAYNRDNLYWGTDRIDNWLLKLFYAVANGRPKGWYQGHIEGSPFWWGDYFLNDHEYVRNLSFDEVNLLRINPSMPYHDPRRPLVKRWFSASDADDCEAFIRLLRSDAQERLEMEGGVCIVATHFGKGFVRGGRVNQEVEQIFVEMASRNGWYPTVGQLLDFLAARRNSSGLPAAEWNRMQWRWAIELVTRRIKRRLHSGKRASI